MLKKSFSQFGQDVAAAEFCGKTDGVFLDLGCNDPFFHNNTYSLESELGWSGVLIDVNRSMIDKCLELRSKNNAYLCVDLQQSNITTTLDFMGCSRHFDYISFDVDDATESVLMNFDFNKYSFSFMTFEHDLYRLGTRLKNLSKQILFQNGYKIYKENVEATGVGGAFEDWWIKE